MKLINLKSRKGLVNLFADFIVQKFDRNSNTIIQVTDLKHFMIVNGFTDSKIVLDMTQIKDEFISENQDLLEYLGYENNINLMDTIKYNETKRPPSNIWTNLYYSERPLYPQENLEFIFMSNEEYSYDHDLNLPLEVEHDMSSSVGNFMSPIQPTSFFPHGYSLNMGRSLMYYSEYIATNIFNMIYCNKLKLMLTTEKDSEGDFKIKVEADSFFFDNEKIKSLILDLFSFDFDLFNNSLKDYDFCDDIKKPRDKKPWLEKNISLDDLIIF